MQHKFSPDIRGLQYPGAKKANFAQIWDQMAWLNRLQWISSITVPHGTAEILTLYKKPVYPYNGNYRNSQLLMLKYIQKTNPKA